MRKGHDIVGLRVVSHTEGEDLGRVLDLVFDTSADQCVALILREKGMFHEAEVVPWEQIETIGPDAVMVRSSQSKVGVSSVPRVQVAMENEAHLTGHRILTTEGKELGTFGDVFLDEATGRVQGYELSGGFVSDTMSGKRYISASAGPDIGQDVVIVPPFVQNEVENQEAGGLQGVAQAAGVKIADAYGAAKDKVTETYNNIAEASIEKQKAFVVGKTASRDVFLPVTKTATATATLNGEPMLTTHEPADMHSSLLKKSDRYDADYFVEENHDGSLAVRPRQNGWSAPEAAGSSQGDVLVRQGEVITRGQADRAESAGILSSLVLAAGGSLLSESYDSARERVAGATEGLQNQVAQTTGTVQQNAEDAAIGKEAGTEVRLSNGSILVAPGMVITREHLVSAKAQGKEKELLAAAGIGAVSNATRNLKDNVQDKAGGLFESVKEKFAELTGTAQEKKEEFDNSREQNAIKEALGRPVNRIILAQDDAIILNTGDIITHKAIEQARAENVLDVLLSSVADVQPEITPDMLRVHGKGSAALPEQSEDGQVSKTLDSKLDERTTGTTPNEVAIRGTSPSPSTAFSATDNVNREATDNDGSSLKSAVRS